MHATSHKIQHNIQIQNTQQIQMPVTYTHTIPQVNRK